MSGGEDKNDKEKNPHEIKINLIELSEFYIKFFNEFNRLFKNCKKAEEIIKNNLEITKELLRLNIDNKKTIPFGSGRRKRALENYVKDKYTEICDFFDLAWGVFDL